MKPKQDQILLKIVYELYNKINIMLLLSNCYKDMGTTYLTNLTKKNIFATLNKFGQ